MNFKEMTLLQLKAYAKEKGIRGVSTLKKNQLIERIIASENKSIQTKAEESIKSEKNTPDSKVKVAVIPTNEELAICRETVALV